MATPASLVRDIVLEEPGLADWTRRGGSRLTTRTWQLRNRALHPSPRILAFLETNSLRGYHLIQPGPERHHIACPSTATTCRLHARDHQVDGAPRPIADTGPAAQSDRERALQTTSILLPAGVHRPSQVLCSVSLDWRRPMPLLAYGR